MTQILQLKIELGGITPEIWRRFLIKDNINFQELHNVIQTVMGWEDYHMFEFQIGDITIGCDEYGFNAAEGSFRKLSQSPEFMKMLQEQGNSKGLKTLDVDKLNKILKEQEKNKPKNKYTMRTKVGKLISSEKQKFIYVYDFGDCWEHLLVVEKILPKESAVSYPVCLEGERNCPPEDCGSVPGYYELMKIKKNKKHPEYEERIVDWLGEDFDFERFSIEEINKELRKYAKVDGRARYWVMK